MSNRRSKPAAMLFAAILLGHTGCDDGGSPGNITLKQAFADPEARQLAKAAAEGDTERIDELLSRGVEMDHAGAFGITPLGWAVASKSYTGFTHLLEKGADPNARTWGDWSTVVAEAAARRDSRFLKAALKHGGDPNLTSRAGTKTPIYRAILYSRKQNVKILIEAGADLNHQNGGGATPAIEAVVGEEFEIAHLLLKHGADPTIRDNIGNNVREWVGVVADAEDYYAMKILNTTYESERSDDPQDSRE